MYIVLVMTAILVFESISRAFFNSAHIWVVEIIEFLMAAYYLLGGGYSMILKGHVRMDLFLWAMVEEGQGRGRFADRSFPYLLRGVSPHRRYFRP
jgi:TRAP-type C4-dicarboxylate transport system permease small subunit